MLSEHIRRIWSRELQLDDFDDDDDFFSLGGHSLIMAKIQTSLVDELGIEVPMDELFRRSTVSKLAAYLAALPVS